MFVKVAGEFYLSRRTFLSLTERTELTERFSTLLNPCGYIISHRAHRVNRAFLRTVSSTQKAFGIQRTQSVSAIVDTDKETKSSLHPPHMGISVITPLPFGGGEGGGAAIFLTLVCSVHLCSSVRNRTHPLDEIRPMRLAGEFFLSQNTQI